MPTEEIDKKKITIPADLSEMGRVTKFIGNFLTAVHCSNKARIQIWIAVDEIFSNIARHADPGGGDTVTVLVHAEPEDPKSIVITFMDDGDPFDPLSVPDPDVTLSARKRRTGGLGLFMVKRITDELSYEYRDEQNILTIRKRI